MLSQCHIIGAKASGVPVSLWESELSPPYSGRLFMNESTEVIFFTELQFAGADELLLPSIRFGVPSGDPRKPLPILKGRLKRNAKDKNWSGVYRPRVEDFQNFPLKINLDTSSFLFLHDKQERDYVHMVGHLKLGLSHKNWAFRGLLEGPAKQATVDPADW